MAPASGRGRVGHAREDGNTYHLAAITKGRRWRGFAVVLFETLDVLFFAGVVHVPAAILEIDLDIDIPFVQ